MHIYLKWEDRWLLQSHLTKHHIEKLFLKRFWDRVQGAKYYTQDIVAHTSGSFRKLRDPGLPLQDLVCARVWQGS